jgi:hypothetical protein
MNCYQQLKELERSSRIALDVSVRQQVRWTAGEEKLLEKAVAEYTQPIPGMKKWEVICELMQSSRSPASLELHYSSMIRQQGSKKAALGNEVGEG